MIKEWIMRKMYYIAAMFAVGLMMSGCGDGLNLPDLPAGTQTDLFEIPLEDDEIHVPLKPETEPMIHCGALHTPEDFERVKANLDRSPWKEGYERLCANSHAQTDYVPNPQASITRGSGTAENYRYAYNDVAAAYQLALRWKISGDNAFADIDRQRMALQAYVSAEREALISQTQQAADDAIARILAAVPALIGKVVVWIILLVVVLVGLPFLLGFHAGRWREKTQRHKNRPDETES